MSCESELSEAKKYLNYYLDNCARCGACIRACHFYNGDKSNPHYSAVYKNEVMRRFVKHEIGNAEVCLKDESTDDGVSYVAYRSCTNCRRCVSYCRRGIDPSLVNMSARAELIKLGKEPQMLLELSKMQLARRQHPESFLNGLKIMLGMFESQIRAELSDPYFKIPLLEKKADVLYVPLSGQHTIVPAAKIFNAAKEKWTMSLFDAANYGFLAGDTEMAKHLAEPIVQEAKDIGASRLVVTECGHAYRVMKQFAEKWFGKLPFQVESITQTTAEYIKDGKIQLDPSKNPDLITHHDPCQHARNGGILEEPRYIIKCAAQNFVEMTPNRENNWCCGGGGGVVAVPEFNDTRLLGGKMKADQIRATDARIVTTTCDNCKLQISDIIKHYGLNARIEGIMDITARALLYS